MRTLDLLLVGVCLLLALLAGRACAELTLLCDPPVVLGQPNAALGVGRIAWPQPAAVNYRHLVKPKPGATVLLAGTKGEPLLVGAPYGKGRVVVFTGTVLGDAPVGQVGVWESPAWADLPAAAIKWAGAKARG